MNSEMNSGMDLGLDSGVNSGMDSEMDSCRHSEMASQRTHACIYSGMDPELINSWIHTQILKAFGKYSV